MRKRNTWSGGPDRPGDPLNSRCTTDWSSLQEATTCTPGIFATLDRTCGRLGRFLLHLALEQTNWESFWILLTKRSSWQPGKETRSVHSQCRNFLRAVAQIDKPHRR